MGYNCQNFGYNRGMNQVMSDYSMMNHTAKNQEMSNRGMSNYKMPNSNCGGYEKNYCGLDEKKYCPMDEKKHCDMDEKKQCPKDEKKRSEVEKRDCYMNYSKKQLLMEVDKLSFYVLDLALFLDTHPNDMEAINKYNYYAIEAKKARNAYEDMFGPLRIGGLSDDKQWDWVKYSWPWEVEC